jgi:hypothetical protein
VAPGTISITSGWPRYWPSRESRRRRIRRTIRRGDPRRQRAAKQPGGAGYANQEPTIAQGSGSSLRPSETTRPARCHFLLCTPGDISILREHRSGTTVGCRLSTQLSRSRRVSRTAAVGHEDPFPRQGRTAGVGSVKRPSPGRTRMSETRRFQPFAVAQKSARVDPQQAFALTYRSDPPR